MPLKLEQSSLQILNTLILTNNVAKNRYILCPCIGLNLIVMIYFFIRVKFGLNYIH